MKRLGWKANPAKIIDHSSVMLVLLIMAWLLFFSKMIFNQPDPEAAFHSENGFIQLAGDVRVPGVYPLKGSSSIKSILSNEAWSTLCDDLPQDISPDSIRTGKKVMILRNGENWYFRQEEISAFYKVTLGLPILINQESEEGLTAIPGVGPQLAKAIAQERDKRGGFHDLKELLSIKGIGPGLIKKIGKYVVF
ncbi:MAG: helix-hairpin-helix domain-containing protein [Deltaproteobacteria bacterium]|nr:helix-hairpin-helix domain-containing protein [Deltaproteobacteria bacterium]